MAAAVEQDQAAVPTLGELRDRAVVAVASAKGAVDGANHQIRVFTGGAKVTRANVKAALSRLLPDTAGQFQRILQDAVPLLALGKLPSDQRERLLKAADDTQTLRLLMAAAELLSDELFGEVDVDEFVAETRVEIARREVDAMMAASLEAQGAAHDVEAMVAAASGARSAAEMTVAATPQGMIAGDAHRRGSEARAQAEAIAADAATRALPAVELAEAAAGRATAGLERVRAALAGDD